MRRDIPADIIEDIAVISDNGNGSTIEANRVAFNGGEPKIDIRNWGIVDGRKSAFKGVRLTDDEAVKLTLSLAKYLKIDDADLTADRR